MSKIDHEGTRRAVCPYCGHNHYDSWEYTDDEGELDCDKCGKEFKYERVVDITYTTYQMEENNVLPIL